MGHQRRVPDSVGRNRSGHPQGTQFRRGHARRAYDHNGGKGYEKNQIELIEGMTDIET